MVCSIDGKVKKVELDITIHRGMFKNKGITGKSYLMEPSI